MRKYFEIDESSAMFFEHKDVKYPLSKLTPLATKTRLATKVFEHIFLLPTNEYIYITIVGDEDQPSDNGIYKGWYLVETMSEDEAKFSIDALSKLTALYQ